MVMLSLANHRQKPAKIENLRKNDLFILLSTDSDLGDRYVIIF
jgi:hypothetical protein